jgi:hypothetical protein
MPDGGSSGFFCPNPISPPTGEVHGIDSEGRVQVTAAEAWPERMTEPSVPTVQETAHACSAFAACADPEWLRRDIGSLFGEGVPLLRTRVQQACLSGTFDLSFGIGSGSREIPLRGATKAGPSSFAPC